MCNDKLLEPLTIIQSFHFVSVATFIARWCVLVDSTFPVTVYIMISLGRPAMSFTFLYRSFWQFCRRSSWTSNNVPAVSSFFTSIELKDLQDVSETWMAHLYGPSFLIREDNEHSLFHCVPTHVTRKHEHLSGKSQGTRSALKVESRRRRRSRTSMPSPCSSYKKVCP